MQLVPHLLLRTNSERSEAAVVLRNGNYLVSRIADGDLAIAVAKSGHVDGVLVDLPLFAAIGFGNAALSAGTAVPMLILSRSPEIVRRMFAQFAEISAAHVNEVPDLVSTVDLMLARHHAAVVPERRRAVG